MIALTEADDTFELFLRDLEARGSDIDLPLMREANKVREEILGIPTGDDTPLPGALIVEPEPLIVFPPPMHEGWTETAEGKFVIPITERSTPGRHYSVGDLAKKLTRTRYWLLGLTMCFISAVFVISWKW